MNDLAPGLQLLFLAYLIGATPFGYLTGRVVGKIDIRQHGSGNIGATNVGRVLGNQWGILVLALDLLKGLVPVAGLPHLLFAAGSSNRVHWQVAAGIATILGHMFPCWLGFRGGKGVATALGVVAYLGGWATVIAAGVFGLSFAVWRIVSLASILAALSFAVCQIVLLWPALFSEQHWSVTTFCLLIPALIIVRHRSNIRRLWRGEEPRYGSGKQPPEGAD
ncbi:MAG: glycerol-3-phosphate 1-O-acyltransferase PlsY [Deltaproteobacteria bacterium]